MQAVITLKSGRIIEVDKFTHINKPIGSGKSENIENFENFYLYDSLLTFVGETQVVSLSSVNIESIHIYKDSNS